ncbi:phage tail tape measure protein [Proteus mirabilis]|uniref:phage tail tape measure protein n=1 Tax=Proteus mirabilis TaxID=584 RepID=UPI001073B2A4|nr:phage tail tape measure protein [Proteus mirabilis]EMB2320790.1 phage tail tape measure protein [Proteus mirabilis]MBF0801206.1 phage tail tape measure protein [Proteus mirabilis]MDM3558026.1 phage tail tape measure protein [Proteus mirabilis]TFV27076.1 phage tail tape measure protein [Proteus mirabilis]HBC9171737.1 phage tail tape measure protein [Proteus mirabilis]
MADVATISLEVRTSDLERGTQKLKEFGDTAEKVSSSSRNLNDQFNKGVGHQKKISDVIKKQREEFDNLLNSINPTNKAFQKLDEWQAKLASASKKGIYPSDEIAKYNQIIEQTRDKLTRVNMSLTAEGRALLAQEAATNRAKQAADDFLNSLKNQTEIIGKTRTEILELKAAQLGVSQQAAPMINRLKEQEKAFMNGSITIGQYRNAMRQLPAQMTDIVTSLASGMPIWMVMIQQGGQIKDSFGGIGNSLKAVTSLITPLNVGLAAAALAVGGLSYATFKAQMVQEAFNRALITSGKYAGLSQGEIIGYANTITQAGLSADSATESLTKLLDAGLKIGVDIGKAGNAIAEFSHYSGKSIDSLVSHFARLSNDPYGGSIELNKQYRYLSASVLQHIKELEDQGKTTEAVTYATDALSGAMADRANEIRSSMGTLPSFFDEIGRAANKMWDSVMGLGADPSNAERLAKLEQQIKFAKADQRRGTDKRKGPSYVDDEKLSLWEKERDELRKSIEADKKAVELQERSINNQVYFNQLVDKGTDNAEKRRREHEKLNKAIQDNIELAKKGEVKLWTDEQIKMAREGIDKAFKDPVKRKPTFHKAAFAGMRRDEGTQSHVIALKAELEMLSQESRHIGTISQQRRALWQEQAKFQILEQANKERTLSLEERALLARKDSILAEKEKAASIGDQIEQQKQLNQLRYSNDDLKAEIELRKATIGMTNEQIAQQRELLKLKMEWTKKGGAETDEEYLRGVDLIQEKYETESWLREQWREGVKKAYAEYVISVTDANAAAQQLTKQAFDSMTGSMTDFLTKSKASFKDYAASFFNLATKMIVQLTTIRTLEAGLGGTTLGNFLGIKGHATGGYTGDGGKYDPAGVVHKGEFVFTKEATQRLGVDNLYRLMDAGKRGYASGGHVGGSAPMSVTQPTAFIARNPQVAGGVNVNINLGGINIPPQNGERERSSNSGISSSQADTLFKSKLRKFVEEEGREGGTLDLLIKTKARRF